MSQNLSSAAVVIGALRVNFFRNIIRLTVYGLDPDQAQQNVVLSSLSGSKLFATYRLSVFLSQVELMFLKHPSL